MDVWCPQVQEDGVSTSDWERSRKLQLSRSSRKYGSSREGIVSLAHFDHWRSLLSCWSWCRNTVLTTYIGKDSGAGRSLLSTTESLLAIQFVGGLGMVADGCDRVGRIWVNVRPKGSASTWLWLEPMALDMLRSFVKVCVLRSLVHEDVAICKDDVPLDGDERLQLALCCGKLKDMLKGGGCTLNRGVLGIKLDGVGWGCNLIGEPSGVKFGVQQ